MAGYPVVVMADAEWVVREWARGLDLDDATGRVFFGIPKPRKVQGDPKSPRVTYPLVTVERIGAGEDLGDLPVDQARISFSVWCDDEHGGKGVAARIARTLASHLKVVTAETVTHPTDGVATIDGAVLTLGPLWRPDGDAHLARYVVDALFTIRP